MKKLVFLFLFIGLSIGTSAQSLSIEEVTQFFEDLKAEVPGPVCDCIEEKKQEIAKRDNVVDSCIDVGMMKSNAFKQFQKIYAEGQLTQEKGDSVLIEEVNRLMLELNEDLLSSLLEDCPTFVQFFFSKVKPEIINLCKETLYPSYQGSIRDEEVCECYALAVMDTMKEDSAFMLRVAISHSINGKALHGHAHHITDCIWDNYHNMGTDDILKVSDSLLESMKKGTKLDYEEESEFYDLDVFCDCFYGQVIGTVTSKEWFEYMNGPNKKIDKMEKKCWKKAKKK